MGLYTGDIFRTNVDGFVEDCDWIKFLYRLQRGPDVSLVTLRIGWGNRHIDVEASFACRFHRS